jgi:hypothetical protein
MNTPKEVADHLRNLASQKRRSAALRKTKTDARVDTYVAAQLDLIAAQLEKEIIAE